ncbi:alpha/beta hydrolase [Echinimonas agarilytica]|uniref:Alpha/beta hydrolase n=1 Tax=Echinimonas agarilytica TaxID=1215918 RepID=A0AA41W733_9GAMM|nr:alpha/beta fold hydrolase [Echinimonas agarilytica]MCM2680337.1 alpha/beta hydrolase [Echinimonas agarilytica]
MELECIVRQTADTPDALVIWLHGLGASGSDFVPAIAHLGLPEASAIRFVFPNAPAIPITINAGYLMPGWYDIVALSERRDFNVPQLRASSLAIKELIDLHVEAGIDSKRIILAGFSQGGAVAYETALRYEKPLGGVLALSTYFPTAERMIISTANRATPIEIHHGFRDEMVTERMAKEAQNDLFRLGFRPAYRRYAMGHEVCMPQLKDIGAFFSKVLAL